MHAGVSARTIQRIETGQRASLESLKCLAAVFETSVSELVQEQTMTNTASHFSSPAMQEEAEKQAIAYVQNVKAFHLHWISFLVIMPLLYVLNRWLSPEFQWFLIVGLCWGAALVLHAVILFGMFSLFGGAWEQREFQKRMNNLRND